ncbi:class I SAM-dependent methyltransferase [Bacillus tianshenii]|nr:class I SAM-dependent methyltransferase [Bacillus tianshenii]
MNQFSKMEKLFEVFSETANILENELSISYLEALAETGENIFQQTIVHDVSELVKKRLQKHYDTIKLEEFAKEDVRKAFQLSVLKGMKQAVQPNHMMTPDAVALFIGYIVNKVIENKQNLSLLDPAIGTANLVTAVLNQLTKEATAYGVEVDETLVKLAYANANLQQQPVELFNQDSLQPLLVDPVDVVTCDLPVGYYPDDVTASSYKLKADEGHSYAHHLFIEQSLKYTKEGGYLIFLIPNFLFESEEASKLNAFLKEEAVIYGVLQLPLTMFKEEKFGKSIFIIRKKGEGVAVPKQAMVAELPSFSNKRAMQSIIQQIDEWFDNQIQK